MTRRALRIAAVSAITALALAACGGGNGNGGDTPAPGGTDATAGGDATGGGDAPGGGGETLHVTLATHPWTTVIEGKIAEFEELSGYNVQLTTYAENQLSDQYNVKFNAGATDIDVAMVRPLQEVKLFAVNNWLAPLDDYFADAADWNWDDFGSKGAIELEGSHYAVPLVTEQEVLYYRTDLLEAAGLEVPTTFDELQAAAQTIQESNDGVYGFVSRGQRSALVTQFAGFLYGYGGDWDDGAGTATINTPEAKAAYEMYAGLLRDYGPPGVTNMSWPEAQAIFLQGNAAFYTDASVFYNNMIDEEQSAIADTFAVAQLPAGPEGSRPYNIPSWALAINDTSQNKDGAWEFIQWATSPEMVKTVQLEGVAGARQSVWDDSEATSAFPDELAGIIAESMGTGVGYDRPRVIEVGLARDIVGEPVITLLDGGDIDAALEKAQTEYQALLDQE